VKEMKAYQITIIGRVQKVGFRFNAQDQAIKLGIAGFVMNLSDGSVYAEAEGEEAAVTQFLIWCHQGPEWAKVMEVKVLEQEIKGFKGFVVKK
jgi:acylphosphatase